MPARVSTAALEVAHGGASRVRVSTVAVEVLHGGNGAVRVSSAGIEVLSSIEQSPFDPLWDKVVLRQTFDVDYTDYAKGHVFSVQQIGAGSAFPISNAAPTKFGSYGKANSYGSGLKSPPSPDWNFGAGDFTVEMWARSDTPRVYFGAIAAVWGEAGQNSWLLGVNTNRTLYAYLSFDGTNNTGADGTIGSLGDGVWTHVCLERSGPWIRFYVDGVMTWKLAVGTTPLFNASTQQLAISGASNGNPSNSTAVTSIDDTRITKGAARYGSDAGFPVPLQAYPVQGDTPVIEVIVDAPAGALRFTGRAPLVIQDQIVNAAAGALQFNGLTPLIATTERVDVSPGALVLTGQTPAVFLGIEVNVEPDHLVFSGGRPAIYTDFAALVPQLAVLAAGEVIPGVRSSQQAILAAGYVVPPVAVSQQAVLILVDGSPCVTRRAQIWTITRRDGVVFRYTSLDRALTYGGKVYKSCKSLNPSASENASTLGSTGNIELEGIIDDDGISEEDLYGGLFDDAYVTVDLVAWGAQAESPRRLASGWTGELSQGETGFKMEVLGAGARLDQQALVQMVTPGCRWDFGDSRCKVDREALKVSGVVQASMSRAAFKAALSGGPGAIQWENGTVRFLTGENAGATLEVRSVDFDTGTVSLWPSAAYRAEPGDQFDLLPGCDKAKTGGCKVYANVINFGGFPDVPGQDSLLETPNAQY